MLKKTLLLAATLGTLSGCVATYDDPYYDGRYDRRVHHYDRHDHYDRYNRDHRWHDRDGRNERWEHCPPGHRKKGWC